VSKRRGNGEGTITQRKDGRWMAQISLGRDEVTGKIKRKTVYADGQPEIIAKLKQLNADQLKGYVETPGLVTFGERLDLWLKKKKANVKLSTWTYLEMYSRVHIKPRFGNKLINKITRSQIQDFILDEQSKLAPGSVKRLKIILNAVFEEAVLDDLLLKNPVFKIESPPIKPRDVAPLTEEETEILLATFMGTELYPVVYCQLGAGLRLSEMLALEWKNIDLPNNTITIKKAYVVEGNKAVMRDDTKTPDSKATIPIPETISQYINELPRVSDYVFNYKGEPITPQYFRQRFRKAVKKIKKDHPNLDGLRFHDLRHNYASMLMACNVHTRLIQSLLRHTSSAMTNRYSHPTIEGQQNAVDLLNDKLKIFGAVKIAVKNDSIPLIAWLEGNF